MHVTRNRAARNTNELNVVGDEGWLVQQIWYNRWLIMRSDDGPHEDGIDSLLAALGVDDIIVY